MSDSKLPLPTMIDESVNRSHAKMVQAFIWANRRCETCDHFEPQQAGNTDVGMCTYNPPTPMVGMGPNPMALTDRNAQPMVPQLQGVFPPTHKARKCGKWEPRVQGSA